MDKRAEIINFITGELISNVGNSDLGFDDDLLMSGLVSSIEIMRLVAFVESTYDMSIPADDIVIEHFETINAIHNYMLSRASQ